MKRASFAILAVVFAGFEPSGQFLPDTGAQPPAAAPPLSLPMIAKPAAVVELLEDEGEALASHLDNLPTKERGQALLESHDRFAGVSCLRVTSLQKFRHMVDGWNFPIVENPQLGEYRYIRFAWKRKEGVDVMLQLLGDKMRTIHRYHAGINGLGWKSIAISPTAPREWAVVTRDLFKDFGGFTLMGLAFTVPDNEAALFDHIYLGRSLADLEAIRPVGVGKRRLDAPNLAELDQLWQDLAHHDAAVAVPARWRMAASPEATLEYLKRRADAVLLPEEQEKELAKLVAELNADDFKTREKANERMRKLAPAQIASLERKLKRETNPDLAARLNTALKGLLKKDLSADANAWTPQTVRELRLLRILEQIGTPPARRFLTEAAQGPSDNRLVREAKAALGRLSKQP